MPRSIHVNQSGTIWSGQQGSPLKFSSALICEDHHRIVHLLHLFRVPIGNVRSLTWINSQIEKLYSILPGDP